MRTRQSIAKKLNVPAAIGDGIDGLDRDLAAE